MTQINLKVMRFSELKVLRKQYACTSTMRRAVDNELKRRQSKKHCYKPFNNLKNIVNI